MIRFPLLGVLLAGALAQPTWASGPATTPAPAPAAAPAEGGEKEAAAS